MRNGPSLAGIGGIINVTETVELNVRIFGLLFDGVFFVEFRPEVHGWASSLSRRCRNNRSNAGADGVGWAAGGGWTIVQLGFEVSNLRLVLLQAFKHLLDELEGYLVGAAAGLAGAGRHKMAATMRVAENPAFEPPSPSSGIF